MLGSSASLEVQSGADSLERGLTSGQQSYDTDPSLYPVSEPREKIEARWQTSGEIQYTGDIPGLTTEQQDGARRNLVALGCAASGPDAPVSGPSGGAAPEGPSSSHFFFGAAPGCRVHS